MQNDCIHSKWHFKNLFVGKGKGQFSENLTFVKQHLSLHQKKHWLWKKRVVWHFLIHRDSGYLMSSASILSISRRIHIFFYKRLHFPSQPGYEILENKAESCLAVAVLAVFYMKSKEMAILRYLMLSGCFVVSYL